MGNPGSPVETPRRSDGQSNAHQQDPAHAPIPGYERLDGPVPVFHAPRLSDAAEEVRRRLDQGSRALAEVLGVEPPELTAILAADDDWPDAPRENERPYPPGLPYFTRSVDPPALVLPERLSPVFQPRTGATFPLAVWHELAHAFLLRGEVVRTPAWLGEFVPQAASAAIAREVGLPLEEHLERVDRAPGFAARGFRGPASAGDQMKFQNGLLVLGVAALEEFGTGFLGRLFRALWDEDEVVDEERAEELLVRSLGPGGEGWLSSRPEF